jgi:hypothetical protein
VARERYLLHGDEETIHQLGAEIKPDSPKSQWENFWYYHKWHVLIGIAVILLAAFLIHDLTSRVNPDYQIGLITQTMYSTEVTDSLESQIARYGTDLNGDGKVVVQVNSYVMEDGSSSGTVDMNVQAAGFIRLTADLDDGSSMIFITDDASFQAEQSKFGLFSYLDGSTPAGGASDYDKMRVSLQDCKLENPEVLIADGKSQNIFENLDISLRVLKGTQLEEKKDKAAYFTASKKLFDQIISNHL